MFVLCYKGRLLKGCIDGFHVVSGTQEAFFVLTVKVYEVATQFVFTSMDYSVFMHCLYV